MGHNGGNRKRRVWQIYTFRRLTDEERLLGEVAGLTCRCGQVPTVDASYQYLGPDGQVVRTGRKMCGGCRDRLEASDGRRVKGGR